VLLEWMSRERDTRWSKNNIQTRAAVITCDMYGGRAPNEKLAAERTRSLARDANSHGRDKNVKNKKSVHKYEI
jgi:hypothetical protein